MATEDAVWSAEATTPDAIEAALRELLVEAHTHDDQVVPGEGPEHDRVRGPRVDG